MLLFGLWFFDWWPFHPQLEDITTSGKDGIHLYYHLDFNQHFGKNWLLLDVLIDSQCRIALNLPMIGKSIDSVFLSFHILTVHNSSTIVVPQKLYKPPVGALLMKSDCPSYFPIHFRLPDDSGLSVRDAMMSQHAQRISGASEYVFPRNSCMDIKLYISVRTSVSLPDLATVHVCSRI